MDAALRELLQVLAQTPGRLLWVADKHAIAGTIVDRAEEHVNTQSPTQKTRARERRYGFLGILCCPLRCPWVGPPNERQQSPTPGSG